MTSHPVAERGVYIVFLFAKALSLFIYRLAAFSDLCVMPKLCHLKQRHVKALVFLYAFEESVDCHLLSSFCDDSNLHISLFMLVSF